MDVTCLVCAGESRPLDGLPMRKCGSCGLTFAHPMPAEPPLELFDAAYNGRVQDNDAGEFHQRLKHRATHVADERLGLWSPLQHTALEWIQEMYEPKTPILEVGPGIGAMMYALRRRGYYPIGLDVASAVVRPLVAEGFPAYVGTVLSAPAITAVLVCTFYVLHHVPDPVEWLRNIRERWPKPLILTTHPAPLPGSNPPASSFPPRTLTWWTSTALRCALERAGYCVTRSEMAHHPPAPPRWMRSFLYRYPVIKRTARKLARPQRGPQAQLMLAVPVERQPGV